MAKIVEIDSTYYAYDGKSGMLAEISLEELNQIYDYRFYSSDITIPGYLKDLLDKGVFLPGVLKQITPNEKELDNIIDSHLQGNIPRTLMLEVTEKCNLKCNYCFFSKEDGFKERKHTQKSIKESTAYKAIDYYYQKYTNILEHAHDSIRYQLTKKIPPMMQWWGGEPFLAFDMLLKTKTYFESLDWKRYGISKEDLVYGLTSNLTIFNEDILNFLVDNNVNLRISLDGDKKSHDKNRVFSNGKGTYDLVLMNLSEIIEKHPIYAKTKVGFQSVLADNIDTLESQKYIEQYFNLNTSTNKVLACSSSPQRKKERFLSELEYVKDSIDGVRFSFDKRLRAISNKTYAEVEEVLKHNKKLYQELKRILLVEDALFIDSPKGFDFISNLFSCPLAADTIFVSIDGYMHCCAKTDYSFSFGHIDTGINRKKLKEIYVAYHNKIDKQCKGCWAYRFCNICPALVCYENEFSLPKKEECKNIQKNALIRLHQYIILTERYDHLYSQIKMYNVNNFKPENDSKPVNLKNVKL